MKREHTGGPTGMRARHPILAALLATTLVCAAVPTAIGFDRGADGDFEKRTSSHFVLYQDVDIDETAGLRGSRRFEQQVLATLEAAYTEADARLGLRPERPITVVVWDPALFDAEFAGVFRFPVAGFYGGRVHIRGDTVVSDRLVRVLHHEHVHAAFDAAAPSLILPAWLNEGVAEWFEARAAGQRGPTVRQRAFLADLAQSGRLFSLYDLSAPSYGHFGPNGAAVAYLQSFGFIDHIAAEKGERRLREWIREITRTGDIDRATRRTFRKDLARLHADYLNGLGAR